MAKSKSVILNTSTNSTPVIEEVAVEVEVEVAVPVKGKRGRKSKKELMAALNMDPEMHNLKKKIMLS